MSRPWVMSHRLFRAVTTVIAIALAVSLSGCGKRPPSDASGVRSGSSGAGDGAELRGRSFTSVAVTEQGRPRALVGGTTVVLKFTDDGRLLAGAGCNTMSAPVTLTGAKLAVDDLATTELGCDPARHQQDEWLAGLLQGTPSWRLDGANLVLTSPDTEIVLASESAVPLIGTRWTVDALVTGETAASVPRGVTATLVFEDGTVTISTGCNTGSSHYRMSGSTLGFEAPVLTKRACGPEATEVEQAVVAVLNGDVSYRIDSAALALTNAAGRGLHLRST